MLGEGQHLVLKTVLSVVAHRGGGNFVEKRACRFLERAEADVFCDPFSFRSCV